MKKIYALLMGLAASPFAMAQGSSATEYGPQTVANTAAAMFRFDDIPVSLHTGVPDISIPLLSLPTRSKDISLNMAMAYHPSSISIGGVVNDDIRQPGWSIGRGGSITRIVSEASYRYKDDENDFSNGTRFVSDQYKFSFMGYSGIFYLIKNANNQLVPSLYAGKGETLRITVDYDPATFRVNSFTVYDSKEYRYVFDVVDRNLGYISNPNTFSKNTPTGFNLSAVYDANGKKLLGFAYQELRTLERPGTTKEFSTVNKLTSIQSEGFGKVLFSATYGSSTVSSVSMTIDEIILSDPGSNIVKRIDLRTWDRLIFRDAALAKGEEYRFSYSDGTYGYEYEALDGMIGTDRFGYPTFVPAEMHEDSQQVTNYAVNPKFCTRNVLEKILLPTGGSILYEYESNTYSYFQGVSISENYVPGTGYVEEPESYYTYYVGEAVYPYNHIVEELYRGRISNSSGFTISGTAKEVCIYIKPYEYFSDLSNTWVEPTVTMNGFPPPDTSIAFQNTHNSENFGYGRSYILPPSRYLIQLGDVSQNNIPMGAYRVIRSIRKNPDIKKWKYGGGIRIKRIAHFNEDVPADLFRGKDQMQYPEYTPVKETYYSYSLFGEPNRSSGNLVADNNRDFQKKYGHLEFVSYRNVTVTDSGNNGKTEYTFTTSADYPELGLDADSHASLSQDFRRGLLKNRKDYDRNNVLVKNTDYTYRFYDMTEWKSFFADRTVMDKTAKVRTASETETLYQPGSAPIVQQTGFAYHRDANRALESKQTTASEGETLKTAYTYLTRNAPLAEQRFSEIEKTENYKNGNLVATAKTDYSNTWPGNVSWMPATISSSTTNKTLAVKAKFNRYDEFGNILEIEQPNGMKTSYVWGYNNTQVVAKIENVAYADIPPALIAGVKLATDGGVESTIFQKLDELRNSTNPALVNAMMTTYTYRPLVGVTTITDPKGNRATYQYDSFGRPKSVKDKDGNILTENQYNYRPNP